MGILRSVALGKSRKSAGELTFYQRIGVSCFRQKPSKSPGYKSSVPQRMQQSVFRFMKANMDAANLKSFVDLYYDAKPRKGKSETKMNMFYRAFMPHLVNSKLAIYELPTDNLVAPGLYLGTPSENNDKLTNGQLGDLTLLSGDAASFTMSSVALDQIIDKANTLISAKETPFTINDLFVGLVAADETSNTGYRTVTAASIIPTLADNVYTFDISSIAAGINVGVTAYVALLVAGKDSQGDIDVTRRKFATDSAKLQASGVEIPAITGVTYTTSNAWASFNALIPTAQITAAGLAPADLTGKRIRFASNPGVLATLGAMTTSGANSSYACAGVEYSISPNPSGPADSLMNGNQVIATLAPGQTLSIIIE